MCRASGNVLDYFLWGKKWPEVRVIHELIMVSGLVGQGLGRSNIGKYVKTDLVKDIVDGSMRVAPIKVFTRRALHNQINRIICSGLPQLAWCLPVCS